MNWHYTIDDMPTGGREFLVWVMGYNEDDIVPFIAWRSQTVCGSPVVMSEEDCFAEHEIVAWCEIPRPPLESDLHLNDIVRVWERKKAQAVADELGEIAKGYTAVPFDGNEEYAKKAIAMFSASQDRIVDAMKQPYGFIAKRHDEAMTKYWENELIARSPIELPKEQPYGGIAMMYEGEDDGA